jgi:hypothetical protein
MNPTDFAFLKINVVLLTDLSDAERGLPFLTHASKANVRLWRSLPGRQKN